MAVEPISGVEALPCPSCGGRVGRAGCSVCHLSLVEIRGRAARSTSSRSWGRATWRRFVGLVAYAGLAVWSWWFMPTMLLFVLPGAVVGAYLHTIRAKPFWGALWCFLIVVVAPLLVWSAGLTGLFARHTGGH